MRLLVRAACGHIKSTVDRIARLTRHDHADGAEGCCAGAYTVAKVRLAAVDVLAVPELLDGDTAVLNGRGRLRMLRQPSVHRRGHLCIACSGPRRASGRLSRVLRPDVPVSVFADGGRFAVLARLSLCALQLGLRDQIFPFVAVPELNVTLRDAKRGASGAS